jgi:hypothetical protein
MIRVVHPGSRIRMLTFYPSRIPDPGVKKAPDPGPGSRIRIRNTESNTIPDPDRQVLDADRIRIHTILDR